MKMFIVMATRASEDMPDLEGAYADLMPDPDTAEAARDGWNGRHEAGDFHFEAYEVEIRIIRKLPRTSVVGP